MLIRRGENLARDVTHGGWTTIIGQAALSKLRPTGSSSEPNSGPPRHKVHLPRGSAPVRTGGYRRRFLIAACCVLALVTGLLTVGTLYILSLPGVGDAAARVERILALHHGIPGGVPPPHKLAAAVVAVEDEHLYSNFLINVLDAAGRAARGAGWKSRRRWKHGSPAAREAALRTRERTWSDAWGDRPGSEAVTALLTLPDPRDVPERRLLR